MKVFFLGTGAAEGIPALFCECEICREAKRRGGKDIRTRSTILIDDTIKIDFPPDSLAHVHSYPGINLARLQHLLFTHSDDDHFAVRELQYLAPNFALSRQDALDVYGSKQLIEKIFPETVHAYQKPPLRFHEFLPFEPQEIGGLEIVPVEAHHRSDELCFNYLVTDPRQGKTLFYGSDTGWFDAPTWTFLEKAKIDTVILECGKGASESSYEGHLNIAQTIQVREKLLASETIAEATPFYLTHLAHTGLLLDKEMAEHIAPYNMRIAYDGLEITV